MNINMGQPSPFFTQYLIKQGPVLKLIEQILDRPPPPPPIKPAE